MNKLTALVTVAALMPAAACATTTTTTTETTVVEEDYRISVEIPLASATFQDEEILRVDELLDERTEFDSSDFLLDEVVLVARSEGSPGVRGSAELLVLEWRSGRYDIPAGGEGDWYEVRVPAPDDDLGGAWLLDLSGGVTVDFLVAVMSPRPRVVEEKTVHHTRTVYRTVDGHRHAYPTYWIYDPTRYYVYHYHDHVWPYRYFTGVWDFRYYHVGFRPSYHRFGIYRGPYYDHIVWRDRYRADRRRYRHGRDADAWRLQNAGDPRPRARDRALARSNPRLRSLRGESAVQQAVVAPAARPDDARSRYEEAKRSHPRLRQLHRNRNASADASERPSASVRESATAPNRRASRNEADAERRASVRRTVETPRRIPTLRSGVPSSRPTVSERSSRSQPSPRASRSATPAPRASAPRARSQTRASPSASGNVRTRSFQQPRRTAAPTVRDTRASNGNVRTRSFERSNRTQAAPRRSAPPARNSAPASGAEFVESEGAEPVAALARSHERVGSSLARTASCRGPRALAGSGTASALRTPARRRPPAS